MFAEVLYPNIGEPKTGSHMARKLNMATLANEEGGNPSLANITLSILTCQYHIKFGAEVIIGQLKSGFQDDQISQD